MSVKFNKYEDYLKMAKDAIDAVKRPFKVQKAKKNLELRIIEIESDIAEKEAVIQDRVTERDEIDWDNIVKAIDSKELQERKLTQLTELKTQLF